MRQLGCWGVGAGPFLGFFRGLGLVWECVPYVSSQGKGLNLFGVSGVEILSQMSFVVVLMVVAGTVDVAFSTQMSATLGLASNAPVVTNMFAMILGGYIGSRSNQAVGIIVAALTIKLFSFGLTSLELSEANANFANMILFLRGNAYGLPFPHLLCPTRILSSYSLQRSRRAGGTGIVSLG